MTSQNFSEINSIPPSNLSEKIREFEYRKAGTLTFFERCCAKKTPEQRQEFFYALSNMDYDFSEGSFCGHNAYKAPGIIKKLGFSNEWTKSLKYAYWFSMPAERKAFTNHILAGVVASRPEMKKARPVTSFGDISTSVLGEHLYSRQNDLFWPHFKVNALLFIAMNRLASPTDVLQVVEKARNIQQSKGLNAGVQSLTNDLMPYFFQSEKKEILENNAKGIPSETVQAIAQKKERVEPFLSGFSWLFLTQARYYQDLEVRMFLENTPKKPQQMLLPLTFGRTRSE